MRNFLRIKRPVLKRIDTVLNDIENLYRLGIRKITSSYYYDREEGYFIKLIDEIAHHFPDVAINFDVWGLPSAELIAHFRRLRRDSVILAMIWSLLEEMRERNHLRQFSNSEMFRNIEICRQLKVNIKFFPLSGLPFETEKEIKETADILEKMRKINNDIVSFSLPNELSPFSPVYLKPEKYHIVRKITSFMDFYRVHSRPIFTMGYEPVGGTEREIQLRQCKYMCPLGSRRVCKTLHIIFKTLPSH